MRSNSISRCLSAIALLLLSCNDLHSKMGNEAPMPTENNIAKNVNIYIDKAVIGFPYVRETAASDFHLISHGRPGALLLDGEWRNARQVASFLKARISATVTHINIYGCAFGKGVEGHAAVAYLEKTLGISVSASDDITGINGDWELEVGAYTSIQGMEGYVGNLQCPYGSYLAPHTVNWVSNGNMDGFTNISENTQNNTGGKLYSDGANVIYEDSSGFQAGDIITIRGNYENDSRRGPLVLTSAGSTALNSGPVMDNAFPANAWGDVTYTIPAGTPPFSQLNITGATDNGVYVNIDIISVVHSICYTCNINTAPALSAAVISNVCPANTYNLNSITAGNTPAGAELTWHTGTPATAANQIANPGAARGFRFYAAFHHITNDCYSGINGAATTAVTITGDADCDGVPNSTDIDNDNDGITDSVENRCGNTLADFNVIVNGGFTAGTSGFYSELDMHDATIGAAYASYNGVNGYTATWNPFPVNGTRPADPTNNYISTNDIANSGVSGISPVVVWRQTVTLPEYSDFIWRMDIATSGVMIDFQLNGVSLIAGPKAFNSTNGYTGTWRKAEIPFNSGSGTAILQILQYETGSAGQGDMGIDNIEIKSYCQYAVDTDGDGIPDYLDLDSDNDGCPDLREAGVNPLTDATAPSSSFAANFGIAPTAMPGSQLNPGAADVNNDGLNDSVDPNMDGITDYASTYLYATGANYNICADSDGDGINDVADIDDDNDGITDAEESPSCFYTSSEMARPSSVSSEIPHTQSISNLYDNNTTTTFAFTGTTAANALGKAILEMTPVYPQAAKGLILNLNTATSPIGALSANATLRAEGWNGTSWVTLATYTSTQAVSSNIQTYAFASNTTVYSKYRLFESGTNGVAINGGTIQEVRLAISPTYIPSSYPKLDCTADPDMDGIPNHNDLDSDGDGCYDKYEANVTGRTLNGSYTDSLAIVHNTTGDAGVNGLSDSVETSADNGIVNYASTYSMYAAYAAYAACRDTDDDGIFDIVDIDDDNDGVLDREEQECVPADYNTNAASEINNIFSKNGIAAGTVLFNQLAEETGLIFSTDSTFSSGILLANSCAEPALYGSGWSTDIWIRSVDPFDINRAVPLSGITFKEDCAGSNEYLTYSAYGENGNFLYTYNIAANIPQMTNQVFDVPMDPNYNVYRIKVTRNANAAVVTGITLKQGFGVPLCDIDIDSDNDGIPNRLDLDSDGDGCTDTREAILYSNSDIPTQPGNVQNGSGGSVTSTVMIADATVVGTYGGNGFADTLQSATDSNEYRYAYTYNGLATSAFNNACVDLDSDAVADFSEDLDLDDDGVPNAVESPFCFFTEAQATDITEKVTSDFGWSADNPLSNTYDDTTTFGMVISTSAILNKALITFDLPVIASAVLDTVKLSVGSTAFGSGTWQLEGRTNISTWDTLSASQVMNSANTTYNFVNTLHPATAYHIYRITGSSGTNITNNAKLSEFSIHYKNYNASKHPARAGCESDTDNDDTPNFYDRDSDGDGCPDAMEAGVSGTLLPGAVHSDVGGSMIVDNAVTAGPYGHDGLADGVETAPESGILNYISTYDLYATTDIQNACLDSDADSVRDVVDIDDDNDGIVDIEEGNCIVGNTLKSGITITKPATINYIFDGSQTLANLVDGTDGTDYIIRVPSGMLNNSEWFRVEFANPKLLTQWEVGHYPNQTLFNTTNSTYKVQGSYNGTSWTDLTDTLTYVNNQSGQSSQANSNIADFPLNATAYKYYRYFGISGSSGGGWATEFYFKERNCTDLDTDSDNIPDRLDLDSDGDGCPDAKEAGIPDNAGAAGAMSASAMGIYSGGIAPGTSNAYVGNGTPAQYGVNGYFNGIETGPESGVYNGTSTYAHFALANNWSLCTNTDGDDILDLTDIDDDNDGILDAVESPACFFTVTEVKTLATVSSGFTFSASPNAMPAIFDNNTATFGQLTTATNILAKALYTIILPTANPQRIVSITDSVGTTAFGNGLWILQGSNNGTAWDTLSAGQAMNMANTKYTFGNTLKPNNAYSRYRLAGATNANSTANAKLQEININYAYYTPSAHPKPTCATDTDFDGILNHLDLDSDGDKCPDAYEAGTYNKAGVTPGNGNVKNGSGGTVTSTMVTANAIINSPYGGNGFADVLQDAVDTNSYKSTYSYSYAIATDSTQKTCCIASAAAPALSKTTDTVCSGTTYNLNTLVTTTAPAYNALRWFTDTAHTNAYNTPAAATAGTYYAFYKDTINNCFSPASVAFTLAAKPLPVGSASPQTICSGKTTAVALNSTIVGSTYTWTAAQQSGSVSGFSNCTSGCGSTIAQTLTGAGVVRYTVTPTANGCAGNAFTVDVTVSAIPVATIAYAGSPYLSGSGTANVTQTGQAGGTYSVTPSGLSINASTGQVNINSSFANTYTVKYIFSNGTCTDSVTTTLTITPTNDTATATPTCPTCPVVVCPVFDDVNAANVSSVTTCGTPAGYTLSGPDANHCYTYTPNGSATDTVEGCIVVCDGNRCDTTRVILYPPMQTISHDWNVGFTNMPVTGNVASNDQVYTNTTYGSIQANAGNPTAQIPVLNSNGSYTFMAAQTGNYTFTISVCAPGQSTGCPTQLLFINVADTTPNTNAMPVANLDMVTTTYQAAIGIPTLSNDASGNYGGSLNPSSVTITDMPNHGTIDSIGTDGNIYYHPGAGFTGTDTLIYRVCDQLLTGNCDTAYQIITVLPAGAANTTAASDDYDVTLANTQVSGNVLTNDIDPQGHNMVVTPATVNDANGTFTINDAGSYTFTPASNFVGSAHYTYQVCDNGTPSACATATVYFLVYPENTTPLPVKVISFTGKAQDDHTNLLSWQVTDVKGMDSYEIRKSTDQKNWTALGSIAADNKDGIQNMQLIDNNPDAEDYYRLVLKGKNGQVSIYPKVVYIRKPGNVNESVNIYPNPAETILNFEYNSSLSDVDIRVEILDITGRKIKQAVRKLSAGRNSFPISLSGLADGSYVIRYHNLGNGSDGNLKFIKTTK